MALKRASALPETGKQDTAGDSTGTAKAVQEAKSEDPTRHQPQDIEQEWVMVDGDAT
jgi:hypothetical protein